jgi:hypothetical protein
LLLDKFSNLEKIIAELNSGLHNLQGEVNNLKKEHN